jgi:hypothetical protein
MPIFLLMLMTSGSVYADTTLYGGQPRIAIEFEHEEAPDHSEIANSVTLIPGIRWNNGFINQVELLVQAEREREKEDGVWHRESGRKIAIRFRKDFQLTDNLKATTRALFGRALNEGDDYTYAYFEPAFKYKFRYFDFTVGLRAVRAIDGSDGHDSNKVRLGPSFDINKYNEIEFRWVRSWEAHSGKHESDAYIMEYIYKF